MNEKRVHFKVYCNLCGKPLHHEAQDPAACKNFIRVQLNPCADCIQGAYDAGYAAAQHDMGPIPTHTRVQRGE